jgi:hypothetical protein
MQSGVPDAGRGWSVVSSAPGWFVLVPAPGPVALVARCAAGGVDLADVERLAAVDPAGLDPDSQVELIEAFERVRAMVDGLQQRALAAVVEATEGAGLDGDLARHEVGAALRLSPGTAACRTRVAADLVGRLPDTLAALCRGEIGYLQARVIAEAVGDLPDEVAGAVAARVLPGAGRQTVAETRRAVERAVIAADPAGAQHRHVAAARSRSIDRLRQPEAMEGWFVTMPAHRAQDAWQALTERARATQRALRAGAGQDPGLDALRVDTLLDAIHGLRPPPPAAEPADDGPDRPDGIASLPPSSRATTPPRCRCGGAQTAAVVIDLPTLFGLAEHAGELPGYGPIPAGLARELARDRDWVRWTVDPGTRRLLDRGARRYRPSGRLRAHLLAVHGRCGFPGCSRRADGCDTDHATTFGRGGTTVVANLGPLCRQHHNAKTHGRWTLTVDPNDDTKTWTSPLGRRYTKGTDPILE